MSGGAVSSKEHSHASSSSSSSLDDMRESLPGIDDRFFAPTPPNSLKAEQQHLQQQPQEEKPSLQGLGSGWFDWAALAGLSSGPQLNGSQAQPQLAHFSNNDVYVPAVTALCNAAATQQRRLGNSMVDDEVQSGLRVGAHQQLGLFHQGSGLLTQTPTGSIDPFGYRYPAQSVGFGFRQ